MVNTIPATSSSLLMFFLTFIIVFIKWFIPFAARNSDWTGIITLSAHAKAFIVIIPREGIQSIKIKSYFPFKDSIQFFIVDSLLIAFTKLTSIEANSKFVGIKSTPSLCLRIELNYI